MSLPFKHDGHVRLPYSDRQEAGRLLADQLAHMHLSQVVVLALPRGGIPVALEVARRLHAPMDLLLVRKIGAPGQPELALAAVVEGSPPQVIMDEQVAAYQPVPSTWMKAAVEREVHEIARRRDVYLRGRKAEPVQGRTVILVDDGIATGTTMRAALTALRQAGAKSLMVAVPVAPSDTVAQLRSEVDEVICLAQPSDFNAIGTYYDDFHQLGDDEVIALLDQAWSMKHHTSQDAP